MKINLRTKGQCFVDLEDVGIHADDLKYLEDYAKESGISVEAVISCCINEGLSRRIEREENLVKAIKK